MKVRQHSTEGRSIIIIFSLIHLIILHIEKSSNPLNLNNKIDQINLNPLFIFKDIIIILILIFIFIIINIKNIIN